MTIVHTHMHTHPDLPRRSQQANFPVAAPALPGTLLRTLAARSQIRELESDPLAVRGDRRLLELSLAHHIASSAASFVAVQRGTDGTRRAVSIFLFHVWSFLHRIRVIGDSVCV